MYIYKITNTINSKVYIGMTTKDSDSYFGSGVIISKAIKKYGREHFIKEIIETCENIEQLQIRERYWISYYKSILNDSCYNVHEGGKGGDWKKWMSHERLEQIMLNLKNGGGQFKKGKVPWNKGLKYSNKKISDALKGRKQNLKSVEKRAIKLTGKKRNENQKKSISDSLKNVYKDGFSEEHKKKLSQSHKGIKMTEIAKQKLRVKKDIVICPHCKKVGGSPIMHRYHFDNCKLIKNNIQNEDTKVMSSKDPK